MSEWRAGDESDEEEEEVAEVKPLFKRLTKGERAKQEDESEYTGAMKASRAPRAGEGKRQREADDAPSSVYERVLSFVATQESTLGVVRPPTAPRSSSVGSGLSPDLALQPWAVAGATLHPHQMAALNWLKARFEMGLNAILADEMGLGKTLTAIALMAYLYELAHKRPPPPFKSGQKGGAAAAAASSASSASAAAAASSTTASAASASSGGDGRVGPFLVLCPLTVLDNWRSELESFAPSLNVLVYTGSKSERESIQGEISSHIRSLKKEDRRDPPLPFHILLTTYESALGDVAFLSRFSWRLLVVDEAHRLKNADSALAQTLQHSYSIQWKLLLTGTPVQNNIAELWSLLWFIHPNLFDDKKAFVAEFESLAPTSTASSSSGASDSERLQSHAATLEHLHSLLRPFMLRRMKAECRLDIPPKREVILRTALTPLQRGIYKNLLLKNYELIGSAAAGSKNSNARALINIVQSLRKCCAHPYLFPGVEPEPFKEGAHIYESSGKFALLRKLLGVLRRLGRRVLLFSTSVQTLDVVQDTLSFLGHSYERLDGSVRGEERYMAIENFKRSKTAAEGKQGEETFVFLLSTRAGGVGLNLCCADTVIFLDSDWNPQCDLQAQARAHRIGQKKSVLVIRLLASNTLEEIILKRTQRKLLMTHNILEKGQFNAGGTAADGDERKVDAPGGDDPDSLGRSAHDLQNILQYGLDHLFGGGAGKDGGGAAAAGAGADAELTEEEIEAIVTGKIDAQTDGMVEESKDNGDAAAAASAASAADSARPSFSRIATHALPSLEEASLAPPDADADSSVYVYEGQDYKAARAEAARAREHRMELSLENVEQELEVGAAKGHQALARMMAAARAAGELDDEGSSDEVDRYGSPGAHGKRKAAVQETDSERAARIARNKELAQKRLESAQKRREAEEAARIAELKELWFTHGYESESVQLDPAIEAQYAAASSDDATVSAVDASSEWGAGGEEDEEKTGGAAAAAASSPRPEGRVHFVVGDATCPFVFEREDGQEGKTSSLDSAGEAMSSFDEAAAAANAAFAAEDDAAAQDAAARSSSPSSALLFVPVDASGSWGKGGLFRALDQRSTLIGAQYELIGSMRDLHMGDVHIVSIPAEQLQPPRDAVEQPRGDLKVALCIVLRRAKNQSFGAPSLQPDHLTTALRKLASYALGHKLSVHLPRLGKDDPNIGWYGIERLLRKHVSARGVDVYVYYFQRRRPQYRSPVKNQLSRAGSSSFSQRRASLERVDEEEDSPAAAAAAAPAVGSSAATPMLLDDDEQRPSLQSELSTLAQYQDIFTGTLIYLHRGGGEGADAAPTINDADARLLTRFLVGHDGEVSPDVNSRVTHIVTSAPTLTPELLRLKRQAAPSARVVQLAWVEQCVTQGRLDDSLKLQVLPAPAPKA